MEPERQGYYIDRGIYDKDSYQDETHVYINNEYNNTYCYLLFFGVVGLFVLTGYCLKTNDEETRESLLNNYSIEKYESGKKMNDICAICLEEFKTEDNIIRLNCSHYYHKCCVIKWFEIKYVNTCPICRSDTI